MPASTNTPAKSVALAITLVLGWKICAMGSAVHRRGNQINLAIGGLSSHQPPPKEGVCAVRKLGCLPLRSHILCPEGAIGCATLRRASLLVATHHSFTNLSAQGTCALKTFKWSLNGHFGRRTVKQVGLLGATPTRGR